MPNKICLLVFFFLLCSFPLLAQLGFDQHYFLPDHDQKKTPASHRDLTVDSILHTDYSQIIYQLPADLDQDGDMDLIVVSNVKKQLKKRLGWIENMDGNGKFSTPHLIYPLLKVKNLKYLALLDSPVDHQKYLIVVSEPSPFRKLDTVYFEISSDLQFNLSDHVRFKKRSNPFNFQKDSIKISNAQYLDFDKDGDKDIIGLQFFRPKLFPSYEAVVLMENKEGNFLKPVKLSKYTWVETFELLDIDRDGLLDLITKGNEGTVFLYKQKKNTNRFEKGTPIGYKIHKMKFFDLDQDDDLDLIGASSSKLFWNENMDGKGTFGLHQIIAEYPRLSNIEVTKINNDSLFDIVLGNAWYKNRGIVSNKISGSVKVDKNKNGCDSLDKSPTDYYLSFLDIQKKEERFLEIQPNGFFQFFPGIGNFSIIPTVIDKFEAHRKEISFNFDSIGITKNIAICLEPIDSFIDLAVDISKSSLNKHENGIHDFLITGYNIGDLLAKSGRIVLKFDSNQISILETNQKFFKSKSDEITFDVKHLLPQKKLAIKITLKIINANINPITSIHARIELDLPAIDINLKNNIDYHRIRLN